MSGYLYRAALSVLNPSTTIHPVVRPMFSSVGPPEAPDLPTLAEEEAPAQFVPPADGPPVEASPPRAAAPPSEAAPEPQRVEPAAERREPPRGSVQVARPGVPREATAQGEPAALFPMLAGPETTHGRAGPPAAPRAGAVATLDPPATEPVIPEPRFVGSLAIANGAPAAPAPVPRTTSPSRRASADREIEDVQIHIGRIEVTAVAAGPARAAAAPPRRKAGSLAEYLRRRDGRG
jgi:hypothetical protein